MFGTGRIFPPTVHKSIRQTPQPIMLSPLSLATWDSISLSIKCFVAYCITSGSAHCMMHWQLQKLPAHGFPITLIFSYIANLTATAHALLKLIPKQMALASRRIKMPRGDGTGPAGSGAGMGRNRAGGLSRGQGQGMGLGMGAGGTCYCPACKTKVKHQRGVPCTSEKCPRCGLPMTRSLG